LKLCDKGRAMSGAVLVHRSHEFVGPSNRNAKGFEIRDRGANRSFQFQHKSSACSTEVWIKPERPNQASEFRIASKRRSEFWMLAGQDQTIA